MAYVNLPPNLKDMFYSLSDRIAKLETGPSQPMDYAVSAQGTASTAYNQAVLAQAQATTAIAQATYAIQTANVAAAQAISAQYVAGVAQTTANGKNTAHYSTSGPSGSGSNGDIWFQVDSGGTVLYQYVYNGSSWISAPISNTVIANLDAGKINAGTITGIAYNNGSGTFYVTPSGALTASNAIITGNITATSGTFTGTVYASSGTFTGTVTATAGSFTGSIYASSGTIGGFSISAGYIRYGTTTLYSSDGSGFCLVDSTNGISINNISVTSTTGASISTSGGINAASGTVTAQSFTMGTGTATFGGTINANGFLYNLGYATTTSAANAYINSSTGLLARSSSSLRYKLNVTPQEIPLDSILALTPKSFYDKASADEQEGRTDNLPRILGLIAEEVAVIPVLSDLLMNKNKDGEPDSVNYDRIAVALLPLLKDHETRLNKLEGK